MLDNSINNKNVVISNRVFVSGLKTLSKDDLKQEFSNYGKVQNVEIVTYNNDDNDDGDSMEKKRKKKKKQRQPFAFVTFESEDVANNLVLKYQNSNNDEEQSTNVNDKNKDVNNNSKLLFTIVKYATPLVPRYAKRIRKGLNEQEQILKILEQKPTLLLQVHSSHLERMVDYISDLKKQTTHPFPIPTTLGTSSAKLKNISFVYVNVVSANINNNSNSRSYWFDHFVTNPVLIRFGLRKVYAIDQIIHVPSDKQNERAKFLVDRILNDSSEIIKNYSAAAATATTTTTTTTTTAADSNEDDSIIMKVQTFPPKQNNLQHEIVEALDRKIDDIIMIEEEKEKKKEKTQKDNSSYSKLLSMSSTDYNHILSCVQVFNPRSQNFTKSTDKCTIDEIFLTGITPITPSEMERRFIDLEAEEEEDKEICRAYYKLKEVMDNYRRDEPTIKMNFKGLNAFDCGSSPGGWTKYLLETEGINTCYSCDPGALDKTVLAMEGTHYLKMRGKDGIDWMKKNNLCVNLWVSDMCLMEPQHQVDHLVEAIEKGILHLSTDDSFFVLTLKFTTGHAKETFDQFAKNELQRLSDRIKGVKNVRTYHLFSNRKGERTLIGRII